MNSIPNELQNDSFTYPNWREDAKRCEEAVFTLHSSLAKRYLQGMKNKQLLYEGRCTEPFMVRLNSGRLNYDGFDKDKEFVLSRFGKGIEIGGYMEMIELKQRVLKHGDRSHPIVQKIDNAKFDYYGWQKDLEEVKSDLFGPLDHFKSCRIYHAEYRLHHMVKKQKIQKDRLNDPVFKFLHSGKMTYPNFNQDRRDVINIYRKSGRSVDELIDCMKIRQKIHDGGSHPILNELDSLYFSYENCEKDVKTIKEKIVKGPITEPFKGSIIYEANRFLKGMKIKQRIHEGKDDLMRFIDSGLFTYDGFENDKKNLMDWYTKGYSHDGKLQSIIEKQKNHNGQRSHPILAALDKVLNVEESSNDNSSGSARSVKNEEKAVGESGLCDICFDAAKTHAFVPCGHVCLCESCATSPNFSSGPGELKCPICRNHSIMLMKIYN